MAKTSETAGGFFGEKLYQQRAKLILPILVRQATAGERISYESLAEELGMTNPRVLNYPLGSVGSALVDLSDSWKAEIPHIQSLVVNKRTGLPGPGFDGFLIEAGYRWADIIEREAVIEEYWTKVSAYPYWDNVLFELNLSHVPNSASHIVAKASSRLGSGEGLEHKCLKEFVRNNPQLFGLAADHPVGQLEYGIASGDRIDVVFSNKNRFVAVEVKPSKAPDFDIARGLFQCVKYRAVLRANAAHQHDTRPITTWLVLGGQLSKELIPLRNTLGVRVIENMAPK